MATEKLPYTNSDTDASVLKDRHVRIAFNCIAGYRVRTPEEIAGLYGWSVPETKARVKALVDAGLVQPMVQLPCTAIYSLSCEGLKLKLAIDSGYEI